MSTRPPLIGCVSYLNAKPLIDGLEAPVRLEVPARLTGLLLEGKVDLALCPVADVLQNRGRLEPVPVGGIGSDGETLTVKLFARVPLAEVRRVACDTDSRTSVNLLRVLWQARFGRQPELVPLGGAGGPPALPGSGPAAAKAGGPPAPPEAMLLIGDKVIHAAPPAAAFPWTLDLGAAWKEATGLPFVFAIWTRRSSCEVAPLPQRLAAQLEANLPRCAEIAARHAAACGWPAESLGLAQRYLGRILHYRIGPREQEAIAAFDARLRELPAMPPMPSTP